MTELSDTDGAIAQMNWGRMKHAPGHPQLAEFEAALERIFRLAEQSPGFVWRIPDDQIAAELAELGHDQRISATVSVWRSEADLKSYTFNGDHGVFLERRADWFDPVDGPQLVMWPVATSDRPNFFEATRRLNLLRESGPTDQAFGWRS